MLVQGYVLLQLHGLSTSLATTQLKNFVRLKNVLPNTRRRLLFWSLVFQDQRSIIHFVTFLNFIYAVVLSIDLPHIALYQYTISLV